MASSLRQFLERLRRGAADIAGDRDAKRAADVELAETELHDDIERVDVDPDRRNPRADESKDDGTDDAKLRFELGMPESRD